MGLLIRLSRGPGPIRQFMRRGRDLIATCSPTPVALARVCCPACSGSLADGIQSAGPPAWPSVLCGHHTVHSVQSVCVCVRACVRACVCACVRACVRVIVRHARLLPYDACSLKPCSRFTADFGVDGARCGTHCDCLDLWLRQWLECKWDKLGQRGQFKRFVATTVRLRMQHFG